MDKTLKTVGDVAKKGKDILVALGKDDVGDWRPASDMYIDEYVTIIPREGHLWPKIPGGILYYLKNGDYIIYINHDISSAVREGGNKING